MKRYNLQLAIIGALTVAVAVSGCTPDQKDSNPAASTPAVEESTTSPVESAPATIPAEHAMASLKSVDGMNVSGTLSLAAVPAGVHISGAISGLNPGTQHGFHIHETGDCSAPDFTSAGGHFNPANTDHGNPNSDVHHAGDMLNLSVDENGGAVMDVTVPGVTLSDGGNNDVLNRAIVIHAGPDDYTSQPAGDSGSRIACAIIAK